MRRCKSRIWAAAACGALLAGPVSAAPSKACQKYGEIAFAAWTQGLYAQVGRHFAPEVSAHLPPTILQEMWEQLQAQAGKFESLGQFRPHTLEGHAMMVAPMEFASRHMAALFTCNARDQIVGLQILDPSEVRGLGPLVPDAH